jgi:hypothetical protein
MRVISSPNNIRVIIIKRMRWVRYVVYMEIAEVHKKLWWKF